MRRPASSIGSALVLALGGLASAGLASTGLAGCSVSDTLTPPVDVGTSGSISKPLTGEDMQTAMRQNDDVPRRPHRTMREQAPEQAYSPYPQPEQQAQPQNSLEAQAQALQNGYNPAASEPLDGQPRRQQSWQQPERQQNRMQEQAGSSVSQSEPEEQTALASQTDEEAAAPASPAPSQQASLAPAGDAGPDSIRFLPIIGAPVEAVTPLSRQLGAEARAKGLMMRSSSGEQARHILKGYFSAYGESGKITVVYVWDILDASGNRLHRIQGQQTVPGKAQDPWAAVPASVMQIIANKTLDEYVDWRAKNTG
ncbi:hypothetical protein [Agrobacterium vitis]|uniref:hypothetical protein n=1 Tax=Agrobacterium vitis TaxID=373 RepID=UPI0012E899C8|nr:hypothetical protein [Agrobacterium vitis]MVA50498.1 hypothetical protein [Agrobacterium vitis]NSZ53587.1 hypothetical protein [Agrobacterium vitis]NTA32346.1 hypothetical protein [Agrobacterium vitis]